MEEALSEPISTDARPLFNATRVSDKIIYPTHRKNHFVTPVGQVSALADAAGMVTCLAVMCSREVCGQKEWHGACTQPEAECGAGPDVLARDRFHMRAQDKSHNREGGYVFIYIYIYVYVCIGIDLYIHIIM